MASFEKEVLDRLGCFSECCICFTTYTDPRLLPCFHTFCLKCFEDLQLKNKKNTGDVLPCPLCRKEFTIPQEGMIGLQKNFFIENLIEMTEALKLKSKSESCSSCIMMEEGSEAKEATMRCLNCCENYCPRCIKMHNSIKATKDHKIVEINRPFNDEEIRKMFPIRNCTKHANKALDYYCSDCKTVVCVSCFVVEHQAHRCKEVETVDEDFRQMFLEHSEIISDYKEQLLSMKLDMERKKREFLANTLDAGDVIRRKRNQLKAFIDQQTQAFLDELALIKQKHQKNMETEIEDIERKISVLESFMAYCTELKLKGSPSEVCGCADNLITRAKELTQENEEILCAPDKLVKVEFIAADEMALSQNISNFFGKFSESVKEFECCFIVAGTFDGTSVSNNVIRISLSKASDIRYMQSLPTETHLESAAAVYCNSIFVAGIGFNKDEIWKFDEASSAWKKCASMVKGRRRHSVAFVDHVLYICGGYVDSDRTVLQDVEAYDSISNLCVTAGKLVYAVHSTGNCVPFKSSIYVFGGYIANDVAISSVQVYDTKLNTCSLLSKPMPQASVLLRAALWEKSVILFGCYGCFIYNFDTEIWEVRDQLKTNVSHFGLTAYNGKLFVIGGVSNTTDPDGKINWIVHDDVRSVPITNILNDKPFKWTHHAKLPKPSIVYAFERVIRMVENLSPRKTKSQVTKKPSCR